MLQHTNMQKSFLYFIFICIKEENSITGRENIDMHYILIIIGGTYYMGNSICYAWLHISIYLS